MIKKKNTFGQNFYLKTRSSKNFGETVYLPWFAQAWPRHHCLDRRYACIQSGLFTDEEITRSLRLLKSLNVILW